MFEKRFDYGHQMASPNSSKYTLGIWENDEQSGTPLEGQVANDIHDKPDCWGLLSNAGTISSAVGQEIGPIYGWWKSWSTAES